jgi:hypothetical protein
MTTLTSKENIFRTHNELRLALINTYERACQRARETEDQSILHPRTQAYIRTMPDQTVTDRYQRELLKLKMVLHARRRGEPRPIGHPNLFMMNLCRRELERRGLPVPQVRVPEDNA